MSNEIPEDASNAPLKSQAEVFFEKGRKRANTRLKNPNLISAVQECWKLIDELEENFLKYGSDQLSATAGRLAILKSYVGAEASKANCVTNNSYIYKKFQVAWQRKKATEHLEQTQAKVFSKDVDAEVIRRTVQMEQDWAFNQENSDVIKNLFDSIEWILTSIGWRMKELNADRYTAKYFDDADESPLTPRRDER